ncbi:MAG: APC family permease [Streptosporangiaceae bacterium]
MFVRRRRRPRATLAKASAPVHGPPGPAPPAAHPPARRFISWTALALLTVGSVGNLGSAPPLAVLGLASVFLYVLPALVFLVPISLVAAELASGWPGGVYNWVSQGISAPTGLLAVWCEFAQTIFLYPALLAYVAGTLAYVFDPGLAANGVYNAVVIIVLFWGGVLLCSLGPALVARLGSGGTRIGTLIPAAILVALGVAYLVQGHHSAAPINARHLLPAWTGLSSIVLVVNSFFTYAGVEVNAVHIDELQAFNTLFTHFGVGWAVPLIAIALAVGALAGMISWLDGPSEGLLLIGRQQGFLPPWFQKVNRYGIEVRIIAAQGVVITLIAVLYAFVPSVSHAYWVFTALATQVYLIMYVLMFIAAVRLRRAQPDHPRGYRAPALGLLCLLGGVSSVAALVIGFIPPSQFGHSNPLTYAIEILAGILAIGIVPPLLMDRLRKPSWKAKPKDFLPNGPWFPSPSPLRAHPARGLTGRLTGIRYNALQGDPDGSVD